MKKNEKGILKSFIEFFYGNFIVLLLGFISLPLITRVMSTEEYGKTSMFQSVVSIIYIFSILGLDQGYIRFFYTEKMDRKKLFFHCLRYPLILILILSGIYFIFSKPFNIFLFEESDFLITALVITYVITSVFERFLFLNIRMDQNGKLYSNLNILSKVLYIAFIFIFFYILGNNFRVVLLALTIPLFIVTVFLLIRFLAKKEENSDLSFNITDKELLKYSVPFIPMLLMEWLLSSMDKWSIRIFNDLSETGIYAAAMQIMTIILTLKITFVAFWSPIAMEKYEKESEENCKIFFKEVFKKVSFLCILMAFGLTVFRAIIVIILGPSYREAVKIIPFLTLMPILSILFEMTGQGVKFVKKVKYFNYSSLVAIICNLILNTIFVPVYKGIGAAFATAVTYIVYFTIGTYFSKKCYKVDYDLKRFYFSLILYMGYAFFATFESNEVKSVVAGVLVALVYLFVNLGTVTDLFKDLINLLSKIKNKENKN